MQDFLYLKHVKQKKNKKKYEITNLSLRNFMRFKNR